MDFVKMKTRMIEIFEKYKYVWIVLLIGMILMMLPVEKDTKDQSTFKQPVTVQEESTQKQMESILCQIAGAGDVKVMLTIAQGERILYQTDSTYTQGENSTDTRTQTILVTDSQRNETGLIHQKNPPVYQGAIVLAEGADHPSVKLAIVEAVMDVTGLGADKISVLKMK